MNIAGHTGPCTSKTLHGTYMNEVTTQTLSWYHLRWLLASSPPSDFLPCYIWCRQSLKIHFKQLWRLRYCTPRWSLQWPFFVCWFTDVLMFYVIENLRALQWVLPTGATLQNFPCYLTALRACHSLPDPSLVSMTVHNSFEGPVSSLM